MCKSDRATEQDVIFVLASDQEANAFKSANSADTPASSYVSTVLPDFGIFGGIFDQQMGIFAENIWQHW